MLPTVQTVIKDSIIETEKIIHVRDTAYIPGDSVEIAIAIPCPDAVVNDFANNGNTRLSVRINKGILKVKCNTDSLLRIIDSIRIHKNKELHKTITTTIQVPVKVIKYRVPKWCWWLLAFNLLAIGWKFRHGIIGLFK